MIKAIFRLIALCVLLTSVPVKADASQYSVFTDAAGNIYLKAPEKFVLIHSDVSVPLFVPPKNGLLKLSWISGSWVVQELTLSQWNALNLSPGNALVDQMRFGDIDGDGVLDLVMTLNNSHHPALSLTNLKGNAVVRSLNTGYLSPAFVLQDVNSDGIMDIVDNNAVFLGQRNGTMLFTGQVKTSADGDNPGLTAAQFRVDESGQATYQIPVAIPAGIAGVQPSVSLSYNSGAGEGIAGMGWNISGLSSIHRCAKSIVQDGAISGVFMNANDGYCLDGQRLILTAGTYGAAGSTYRLEIDDFSVITAIRQDTSGSGPQGFEVQTKAKETMYFGNTDFSTSDADAFVEPGGKAAGSVASSWALKGIKDGYGNYIEYVYRKGGLIIPGTGAVESAGVFVIDSIRYTGTSSAAPFASINFNYDTHPSPRAGFGYGGSFYQKYRLESISVLLDGEAYRYYDLGHDNSQYGYLDWVQECLAADRVSCRNALTFDYHKQSNTLAFNASESMSSKLKSTSQFFDINGDGRADMVYTSADGKTLYIKMAKAEGGFGSEEVITSKLASAELINFVDVNGDGNIDIFYPEDSSWKFAIYQPTTENVPIRCTRKDDAVCKPGQSYSYSYTFTKKIVPGWTYNATALETYKNRFFADVNGDGLMDWAGFSGKALIAFLNVDKTFSPTQTVVYTAPDAAWPAGANTAVLSRVISGEKVPVGDFNGDGVSDMIVKLSTYASCGAQCSIPTNKTVLFYSKGPNDYGYQEFTLAGADHRTADLNGDGLSDLMYIHNNAWKYQLSTGQMGSATSAFSAPVSLSLSAVSTTEDYKHLVQLADLDNNGKADILAIESTSIIRYFCRDTGGAIPYSQLMTESASVAGPNEFEHDGPVCPDLSQARQEPSTFNSVMILTSTFDTEGNFGFSEVQELAAFVPVNKETVIRLADINADGDTDLLFTNSKATEDASWTAYHNNMSNKQLLSNASPAADFAGIPKHQLKSVTNGFGVKTEISYKPMTDSSVYKAEPTINSSGELNPDYISPKYGMWLVDTVTSQTNGSGSSVETVGVSYNYAGYRLHKKGWGALGFASLTTKDLQSGIETTTEYDQNWPFIGRPVKTTSTLGSLLLSEATSTWTQGVSASGGPYVYLDNSVEKGWQIDSANTRRFVSHIVTSNVYDKTSTGASLAAWGNLTKSTVSLHDASGAEVHSTESIHTYEATNVTDYLRYGRLSASVVTKKQTATDYQPSSTQSRSSTFTYDDSGYLKTETIGSDCVSTDVPADLKSRASTGSYCDSSNISTKTYAYDKYGNIETLTVTASGDSRAETTSYSTDGRFVVTKTNALNQQEQYLYNGHSSARGIVYSVTSTGPNGVSSTTHMDGWGQGFQVTSADGNVSTTETLLCSPNLYGGICGTQGLLLSKTVTPGAPTTFVVTDQYGRKVRQASTTFAAADSYSYVDFVYDKHGNLTQQSDPYFNIAERKLTIFAFDTFQRPTKVTYPGGVTSQVRYWGLQTSTVDENDFWRDEYKDVAGRTISTTDPYKSSSSVNVVTFRYSAFGDLLTQSVTVNTSAGANYPAPPGGIKPPEDGIDPPTPPAQDFMSFAYSTQSATGTSQVVTITHSYDSYGRKLSTQDATKGTWYYGYNGFGEQVAQLNGRNESSTLEYNQLGQLVAKLQQRSLNEGGGFDKTCYSYGNNPAQKNVGKLVQTAQYSISADNTCAALAATTARYSETQSYDLYGRPASSEQKHSGKTFTQATHYDAYGRVSLQVLPLGRVISLEYQNGYQKGLYEYPARTLLSEVESMDAAGRVTQEKLYGGTSRATAFDQDRGFIDSITVSKGSSSIYNVSYDYDNKGTTELRTSHYYDQNHVLSQTISEDFKYSTEGHSRLTDRVMTVTNAALSNHVSTITESMGYDGFGNITRKTGTVDNIYTYDQTNPYQLNTVTGNRNYSMVYDAHGNITDDGQREFKYSSSDMPLKIEQNGTITEFAYGPDNQRFYRKDSRTENGVATTTETFYAGKVYEQNHKTTGSQSTASIEHRWYIGPVVITNFESGSEEQYEVLHGDALGSTVAVTDGSGNLKAHYLYDAWGKQSQIMTGFVGANPIAPAASRRAYTGHENIEGLDIIHMNGRIYDATLARFMQADPFVQAPTNTQSYNRYSYVLNNPLSYTDPSGFIFKKLNKMLGKFAPLLGVALLFVPVIGQWAALNMWNAAMYGFMAGGVASGSLKGALVGALSGAAFQQIGASFDAKSGFWEAGGVGHVGAHATTGGISSVLQGGKFGHGFVSAGFTKAININNLVGTQQGGLWDQVRISAAAVVGGTISKITGGKFANGAITAGFAQAFNGNKQAAADDYKKKIQARVSVSTTTDGESHVYRIKGLICNQSEAGCNGTLADRVFDSVNRNDVPFTSNDLGNGTSNLLGFNPVTHTEYPDMRMSVNTTMEGHTFHPGDVVHSVYFDEGNLYYEVIGTGGVHPNLNNAVGVYLFKPGVESAVYNFQSNSIWRKAHGF